MIFSEEQQLIQESIRQFAQEQIVPFAAEWDKNHHFPTETIQAIGELGLMGMIVPEEYGGSGSDYLSLAIAIEEIAAADSACSTIIGVNNSVVCMPIFRFGTDFQKEAFLNPLASGSALGCFCLTEPEAGSDAAAIKTKAEKTQQGYILNGCKQFITSGKNADYAIVFAVTDSSAGKKGISAFIVPTKSDGYIVSKIEEKLGQNASDTAQIIFENCEVPHENLLGKEGEGYKIALSNLEGGRISIAAQCVGVAKAALACAQDYAADRQSFGKPLHTHQAVSFMLAEMATQVEAARQLVFHAASLKDAERPSLKEAAMAKLFASEVAEQVCSQSIQILGGYGYLKDFPAERYYRDARVMQIYEGTSEIQKMIISRQLLND